MFMTLKDRLKKARLNAGKTQLEVAQAVKMSQPAYQALETGRNKKSAYIPLIANYLDVDVYWLTFDRDESEIQTERFSEPNEEFKNRLKTILEEKGLKQADIARATGKSSVAVTKWMRGENIPKADALKSISKLLNVSDEWLLTGKDAKKYSNQDNNTSKKSENSNVIFLDQKVRTVPILDLVQAGNWREAVYDGVNTLGDVHTTYMGSRPEEVFSIKVAGDSMTPRFFEGDLLLVDPNRCAVSGSFVIACNNDHENTFKKYRITGYDQEGMEEFELVALNPDFGPLNSKVHKIKILGVVVEHITKMY